jgi:hypothetical protein
MRFQVFTAVKMFIVVFWSLTPCNIATCGYKRFRMSTIMMTTLNAYFAAVCFLKKNFGSSGPVHTVQEVGSLC